LLDVEILKQQLGVDAEIEEISRSVIELTARDALSTVFFWMCSQGWGATLERKNIRDFPDAIECERCGQVHYFSQEDVQVHFLPTDHFREELVGHPV
jgi:hypothetical protein